MSITTNEISTRPADAREIMRAIAPMTLMACGARSIIDLGDGVQFTVGHGHQLIIKLSANDTFVVERVRTQRGTFAQISVAVATDVHVEDLDRTVLELGDRS